MSNTNDPSELSVYRLATILLRRWKLILGLPAGFVILALAVVSQREPEYLVQSRFITEAAEAPAQRLSGLAAQFGFSIPAAGAHESPEFYAELLRSRSLLRQAALTQYHVGRRAGGGESGTIAQLLKVRGDTAAQLRRAIGYLVRATSVRTLPQANLIVVRVRAPAPGLAEQVNRRLLDLVNEFNVAHRRSRAQAEAQFLRERVEEASADFQRAEHELKQFLESNVRIDRSPSLEFRRAQLQREVDRTHGMHASLLEAFEQARLEQVRTTPVVTVIDHPEGAARRTSPGFAIAVLLSGLSGFIAAVCWTFAAHYVRSQRVANPADYAAWRDTLPRRLLAVRTKRRQHISVE